MAIPVADSRRIDEHQPPPAWLIRGLPSDELLETRRSVAFRHAAAMSAATATCCPGWAWWFQIRTGGRPPRSPAASQEIGCGSISMMHFTVSKASMHTYVNACMERRSRAQATRWCSRSPSGLLPGQIDWSTTGAARPSHTAWKGEIEREWNAHQVSYASHQESDRLCATWCFPFFEVIAFFFFFFTRAPRWFLFLPWRQWD